MQIASGEMPTERLVKIASLCFVATSMLPLLFTAVLGLRQQKQETTVQENKFLKTMMAGWTLLAWMIALGWGASEKTDVVHETLPAPSGPILPSPAEPILLSR